MSRWELLALMAHYTVYVGYSDRGVVGTFVVEACTVQGSNGMHELASQYGLSYTSVVY